MRGLVAFPAARLLAGTAQAQDPAWRLVTVSDGTRLHDPAYREALVEFISAQDP